ncbi:hypothetical protein [Novosphingobium percolationis]|uniref:hypothetical protein n=1 Tax=Novosphingobium percolationis TaxID=2871811 RepID=UPI001CD53816|nr:hypothetical protein [Novosphingobium percolationis]
MNIRFTLIALAALSSCEAPKHSATPSTKNLFSFRNMVALETKIDEASSQDILTECQKNYDDGSTLCGFHRSQIAGVDVQNAKAQFVDGTFDYLDATFNSVEYVRLRNQLIQVYGKPCQSEAAEAKHRAALGLRDRGRETQWCFDNGFLSLMEGSRHGWDGGELEFISNRQPQSDAKLSQSNI